MSQTAARAIRLLELAVESEMPLSLMDFASRAGMDKSTCSRLLRFLEESGYLVRDGVTKRFTTGPALLALATSALRTADMRKLVHPHLERFRDDTGETAALHVRLGDNRVCIDGVESFNVLRRVVPLGESFPLASGPAGKVILAFLADVERERHLAGLPTPSAREVVRQQLIEIRQRGYMLAVSDRTVGVSALAAPLLGRGSRPLASITIAGPAERWTPQRMEEYAPRFLVATAGLAPPLGAIRSEAAGQESTDL